MKLSLLLDDAKKAHDTLVATLSECFEKIDPPLRREYFDNDNRRWVIGFDLSLELAMLQIALAGDKNPIPYLTFIRAMNYFSYDIVEFTNEYLSIRGQPGRFIYDDFLEEGRNKRLLALVQETIEPIIKDSLAGVGASDFILDKDQYQILEDNILRIVDCFLLAGKSLDEEQTRRAIDSVRVSVLLPIVKNNDDLLKRTKVE